MKKLILFFICLLVVPCRAGTARVVELKTNFGDIVIELFDANAPVTVGNFLMYVNSGFYDGLIFHRVVNDFVIQVGAYDVDLNYRDPCEPIINESNNGLSNIRGTIAMARDDDPNSATSQFFINQADNNDLDWEGPNDVGYCVFGEVISDMNVVDAIAGVPIINLGAPFAELPVSPVVIYTAEILGDLDGDFKVDFKDYSIFAERWLQCGDLDNDANWTERAKLTDPNGEAEDWFGYSVSISGDYAIVGVINDNDNGDKSGSAHIFERAGTRWMRRAKLTASDGEAGDKFGVRVSISADYAIVGAWLDDDNGTDSGSAYIFYRNEGGTDNWGQQAKLTALDGAAGDKFGYSVSISGDYAIVGAIRDDDNGTNSGSAYMFKRDGTSWTQQNKLTASDGAAGDRFGYSVSISDDYAIVGARWDDDGESNSGSAYIFTPNDVDPNNWDQQAKLTASDAAADDEFGFSVSISGDYAIVGARWDDGESDSGSAYIFTPNDVDPNNWDEAAKLTASDGEADDWFGYSVSISGDYAIVGATGNVPQASNPGSAYIFKRDGTSWAEAAKLTAADGIDGDWFGFSASISGYYAIVGAAGGSDYGDDSGSSYIFEICPIADLNGDCCVGSADLGCFVDNWLVQ